MSRREPNDPRFIRVKAPSGNYYTAYQPRWKHPHPVRPPDFWALNRYDLQRILDIIPALQHPISWHAE